MARANFDPTRHPLLLLVPFCRCCVDLNGGFVGRVAARSPSRSREKPALRTRAFRKIRGNYGAAWTRSCVEDYPLLWFIETWWADRVSVAVSGVATVAAVRP